MWREMVFWEKETVKKWAVDGTTMWIRRMKRRRRRRRGGWRMETLLTNER
jgi:hypothetical protein